MKILYVSHRYHTNQVPIMKGWGEYGAEVTFLAQYKGVSEIYDFVDFHLMKPSLITKFSNWLIDKRYSPSVSEGKKTLFFIPNIIYIYKLLRKKKPDLIILREHTIFNMIIWQICKLMHIKNVIMYTQIPLYGYKARKHFFDFIAKRLFPKICFTPILYNGEIRNKNEKSEGWFVPQWFVPLVAIEDWNQKDIIHKDIIQLLDVGKFREYKNHFFLVDSLSKVKDISKFKLTIIGQVSQSSEEEYYNRLKDYIAKKGLTDTIKLKRNVPFKQMSEIYDKANVLILPSKNESAGMVILESMAKGICVMSSKNCGLSSYLEEYNCGFVFSISNNQLTQFLDDIADNPQLITTYGEKGRNAIKDNFSFKEYFEHLNKITTKCFNLDLNKLTLKN